LKSHLLGIGFTQCIYDPCTFTKSLGDGKFAFIAFYVDNIILRTNDDQEMLNVICSLEKRFHVKDLGEMHLILGMECTLDKKLKTMKLTQAAKIIKLAKQLKLGNSGPTPTPYNPSLKIVMNEEESIDPGPYCCSSANKLRIYKKKMKLFISSLCS
jgi:hypothetical protein